eukprot:896237-Pyramimonas_sp.AAC.1
MGHRGSVIDVSRTPPSMLTTLMLAGIQRQHEISLAAQLGAPTGSRASLDFVRSFVGRSRRLSSLQKFLVGSCSSRGVWTKARAQAAGYLCD